MYNSEWWSLTDYDCNEDYNRTEDGGDVTETRVSYEQLTSSKVYLVTSVRLILEGMKWQALIGWLNITFRHVQPHEVANTF